MCGLCGLYVVGCLEPQCGLCGLFVVGCSHAYFIHLFGCELCPLDGENPTYYGKVGSSERNGTEYQ